jgi:plastocyanin
MRLREVWVFGVGVALAASVAACGGSQPATSQSAAPAAAPAASNSGSGAGSKVDPATAANITGKAMVDGAVPANEPIKMNADPVCAKSATGPQSMETYMVGADGKSLGNVFVHVKDGLAGYTFDPPTQPARIDQQDCRYHPHVFGIQVGQPLEIINSDPTLHNIHAVAKNNREFNQGQPIQGMKTTHTFTAPEVMVPFKCDVHGWMNAYVGVVDNPYYAVTDATGSFSLKALPPGTYTIEAWHEKLGTLTQTVTIAAKETKDITFTFKAPAAAAN